MGPAMDHSDKRPIKFLTPPESDDDEVKGFFSINSQGSLVMHHYNLDPEVWYDTQIDTMTCLIELGVATVAGKRSAPEEDEPVKVSDKRVRREEAVTDTGRPRRGGEKKSESNHTTQARPQMQIETRSTPVKRAASSSTEASPVSSSRGTPKPKKGAKKGAKHDETRYTDLPDICPSVSILDNNPDILSASWHNNKKLDLDDDPDLAALHSGEVKLARVLRLSCNSYMVSKRRIFMYFAIRASQGQSFRKTQAQEAVNIDVNKASQLHAAFEKAGWFNTNSPYWANFFAAEADKLEFVKEYCRENNIGKWK